MPSTPDPGPGHAPGPGPDERPARQARVTLIGKPGCHLCDAARAVVAQVTDELGESFVERSVLDEPELLARYAEEIPVTLVDGRQHDFWRVDADRLRAALSRPRA